MSKKQLTVGDLREFIKDLPDDMSLSITITDGDEATYEFSPDLNVLKDSDGNGTLLDFDVGEIEDLEYVDPDLLDTYLD